MFFFLDTNIIVDLLQKRVPHFDLASEIFNFSTKENIVLFASSHSIATVHYICKKNIKEAELRELINEVLNFLKIIPVDEEILRKSIKSNHKDFEDAIQIFCAHQIKNLTGIITRNIKDFSTSEIPVFAPDEALNLIQKKYL
ncbi:PIN domain-containing protein [Epilithonimonas sp. JDS]|uniref:type II toxin-antitoxin system VapC family toxin n=1 Tax=Epilithonimonas sp. JDS TaxID=2902797 RepID=UPI001E4623A6|nr:PIN domain-containing protein [Epilithonimonas sp. JDS]MCD9855652.1 PIN domain-containing protein [Epilithonimonas sp. JDS]